MPNEPFVIERTFNAPIETLWTAITDKDVMKQWYFNVPMFKPVLGCEFEFTGQGKDGTKEYIHKCIVTEVIVGKKIAYSWRYEGFPGISLVTMELIAEGDKTKLKLTHEGLESFSADNGDFAKANFVEGWTYIIGESLKKHIENAN